MLLTDTQRQSYIFQQKCIHSGAFTSSNFHSFCENCEMQTHHAHLLPHSDFSVTLSTVKKRKTMNNHIIKFPWKNQLMNRFWNVLTSSYDE